MNLFRILSTGLLAALLMAVTPTFAAPPDRVLVFTKTAGFRHDAIPTAVATLETLAADAGMVQGRAAAPRAGSAPGAS